MKGIKRTFVCLSVLFLTACAAGVSYQEFRAPPEPLKTIALLSIPQPPAYAVNDFAHPGMMFGAVGGAFAGGRSANATEVFTGAVRKFGFDLPGELQTALTRSLQQSGYRVVVVHAPRKNPMLNHPDYATLPTAGADAWLDVAVRNIGYSSVNLMDPDFRPHVHVTVRLVSTRTKAVLYSESILFGYENPFISGTQLPTDKRYYFKKFDDLMAGLPAAIEGLRAGIQQVTGHIAGRLKR